MTFSTASIIRRYMSTEQITMECGFCGKRCGWKKKRLEDALQRKLHAVTGKRVKGKVEGRSKMSILLGWWVAQELIDD